MPNRLYHKQHNPPTVSDHILAHPWGVIFGTTLVGLNVMMFFDILMGVISPGWHPVGISPTVEGLPALLGLVLCTMLIAGHVLIIKGLTHNGNDLARGFRLERTGTAIAFVAWLSYGIAVLHSFPNSIYTWGIAFGIAGSLANRWIANSREEEAMRKAVCPYE